MFKYHSIVKATCIVQLRQYLQAEIALVAEWNPKTLEFIRDKYLASEGNWAIVINHDKIIFMSNTRFFSIRKGLRINAEKGIISIQ